MIDPRSFLSENRTSMKTLIILFTLFFVSTAFAKPRVGTVVKLRGKATFLSPGSMKARYLKLGQKVNEDTSVLTEKRSFVRIKFVDDSVINIGPESKAVIVQMKKGSAGIISLLKGKLRTKVQKAGSEKNKFFIRTRSAAMGVRGTEFQTIYNPENNVTSLLTYQGEVAIVKTDDKEKNEQLKRKANKKVNRLSDNSIELKEEPILKKTTTQEMNKILSTNDTVIVKRGQFSGTVGSIDKVSQPVKISPTQLNILFKNTELVKNKRSRIVKEDTKTVKVIVAAEQEAPPEGFFDKETGKFAPKSGGFLDMETALYIPPNKDSEFDQKTKTFKAKDVGFVDKETGQYLAPKGLKLDSKKGFIVKDKSSKDKKGNDKKDKKEKKEVLLAMTKELNTTMANDVVLGEKNVSVEPAFTSLSSLEKISKNALSFQIRPFETTMDIVKDTIDGQRKYITKDGKQIRLTWTHASGSKIQPITYLAYNIASYNRDQLSSVAQTSEGLIHLVGGLRKYLSTRWNALAFFGLEQEFFINHVSQTSGGTLPELTRVTVPRAKIGVEGILIRSGSFTVNTKLLLRTNLPKKSGPLEIESGLGGEFEMNFQWSVGKRGWINIGLFGMNDKQRISNGAFSGEINKETSGAFLSIGQTF